MVRFNYSEQDTAILHRLADNHISPVNESFTSLYRESPIAFDVLQLITSETPEDMITLGTVYDTLDADTVPLRPVKEALHAFERIGMLTSSASNRYLRNTGSDMYSALRHAASTSGSYKHELDYSNFTAAHTILLDHYLNADGVLRMRALDESIEHLGLTDHFNTLADAHADLQDWEIITHVDPDEHENIEYTGDEWTLTDTYRAQRLKDTRAQLGSHTRAFRFPDREITPETREHY